MITLIEEERMKSAKKSFVTRNVTCSDLRMLCDKQTPKSGDLVLVNVVEIGKQKKIELTNGRKSNLHVGDELIVAYGNRYAPDQYEAEIPTHLEECDLVATGGIASQALSWSSKVAAPTRIKPVGLLSNVDGTPVNVADYAIITNDVPVTTIPIVAVVGSSMNSGKTTTAESLVRGLSHNGHQVGFAKVTGTGSGGDLWTMHDAGALAAVDFTDAGMATTFKTPINQIEKAAFGLVNFLAKEGCSIVVVEIADGIFQQETAALIETSSFTKVIGGFIYAADGSPGAVTGTKWLSQYGNIIGLSGLLTASPLASREAELATGYTSYSPDVLANGEIINQWFESNILFTSCKAQ